MLYLIKDQPINKKHPRNETTNVLRISMNRIFTLTHSHRQENLVISEPAPKQKTYTKYSESENYTNSKNILKCRNPHWAHKSAHRNTSLFCKIFANYFAKVELFFELFK